MRTPRFAVLACALAAALPVSACRWLSHACTLVGCTDGPEVTLHFHRPVDELLDATITTCLGDTCTSHRPRDTIVKAPDVDSGRPSEQGAYEHGFLWDLGEGWTTLWLFAQYPGPFLNGDRYRVAVKGADGVPILEVERRFEYVIAQPNGPECDPTCHVASVNLYEDSPSGLTCRGTRCVTSLRLITHLPDTSEAARSIVTVCRNAVCATTDNRLTYFDVKFEGELRAAFSQFSRDGAFEISIGMSPDSAVLADGDVYRIRIVDSVTGAVLKTVEQSVAYETSSPSDAACDLHPCRGGLFTLD